MGEAATPDRNRPANDVLRTADKDTLLGNFTIRRAIRLRISICRGAERPYAKVTTPPVAR